MFSAIAFAKWDVGTAYATDGGPLTTFTTYDLEKSKAYILIGVSVDSLGYSAIIIAHYEIEEGDDNIVLIVTDNEGNDMRCTFHEDDIEDCQIRMTAGRSTVLTKMLYNGKSAKLMKNFKPIATFDLSGIKQIMRKHVGSSYWYKYKLND